MYIFDFYVFRDIQVDMGKIPYPFDTVINELLSYFGRTGLGYGKHSYINIVFLHEVLYILHGPDCYTPDLFAEYLTVTVKYTFNDETSLFEIHIVRKSLSKISRTYKDKIMLLVKAQYSSYLIVKVLHIISLPLLAETSEIVKVLPDLGCRHLHEL